MDWSLGVWLIVYMDEQKMFERHKLYAPYFENEAHIDEVSALVEMYCLI